MIWINVWQLFLLLQGLKELRVDELKVGEGGIISPPGIQLRVQAQGQLRIRYQIRVENFRIKICSLLNLDIHKNAFYFYLIRFYPSFWIFIPNSHRLEFSRLLIGCSGFSIRHTDWLNLMQFLVYKLKIKIVLRLTKRGDLAWISRDVHNSKVFSSDLLNFYNHYRKMSRYQSGEWWYCDWTGCIRISTLAANQYHFIAT